MHMCHGICNRYKIPKDCVPGKHNGYTRIYERCVYCKGCACYFKPEDAYKKLMCPCCHRKLRTRPKQKRNRVRYVGLSDVAGRPIRSLLSEEFNKTDDGI